MQLQVECNHVPFQKQPCLICNRLFEMAEAKIIACDDQGNDYGEVCPKCLKQGFHWLSDQFEQLSQPKKTVVIRQTRRLKLPIGA